MSYVLDASAVLAYLHREPGWEIVRPAVVSGRIGAVNWSEVAQMAAQRGVEAGTARALLVDMGLDIVPFTASQADRTAALWAPTRRLGLSLADRACLALGLEHGLPVLTADRTWQAVDLGLELVLIR